MAPERRRAQRFDANLFLDIQSPESGETAGRGVVVDVSSTGMAIDTEATLDVNHDVECHVEIPLIIRARVVRLISQGHMKRYGVRFEKQSFFDRLLLRRLLKGPRRTRKVRF